MITVPNYTFSFAVDPCVFDGKPRNVAAGRWVRSRLDCQCKRALIDVPVEPGEYVLKCPACGASDTVQVEAVDLP